MRVPRIGALFVPLGVALGLATTGLVLEAAAMFAPHVHLKPHGGYLSERNGLFTMIVLGEGVISLVLPGACRPVAQQHASPAYLASITHHMAGWPLQH